MVLVLILTQTVQVLALVLKRGLEQDWQMTAFLFETSTCHQTAVLIICLQPP